MKVKIRQSQILLVQDDITKQHVDVIVNAANSQLAGGGGVDGAIHRAAGPSIIQETANHYPQGCATGHAVATSAGQLSAKYLFHAVGPIWRGGTYQEEEQLRSAYRTCLQLCMEYNCREIAFPAISTGVYGYPVDLAAEAIIDELGRFLQSEDVELMIKLVLFNAGHYGAFARVLESYQAE